MSRCSDGTGCLAGIPTKLFWGFIESIGSCYVVKKKSNYGSRTRWLVVESEARKKLTIRQLESELPVWAQSEEVM